jgi:hypothetical protein
MKNILWDIHIKSDSYQLIENFLYLINFVTIIRHGRFPRAKRPGNLIGGVFKEGSLNIILFSSRLFSQSERQSSQPGLVDSPV